MPPKRRASGTPATSTRRNNQQPTLSFHGKNQNRVTKPVSRQHDAKKSIKDPAPFDLLPGDAAPELLKEPTTAEIAIEEQTRSATKIEPRDVALKAGDDALGGRVGESAKEKEKRVGGNGDEGEGEVEVEVRARKIGEAQIARYWRAKEQERKAPRVHQEGLTVGEKVLREWDMSGHYGPCIGIARLKRWKRAEMLGLHPPIEVLAVLLKQTDQGETSSQRAHVDQLMSSRFIET